MATSSKKTPAKVATKKVAAPKPVKEKAPKPAKAVKSTVKLISFGVTATIPTQQYGNIMPNIVVEAGSIEEARAVVMPLIEDLYKTYAEKPRDGRPLFEGSKVTETVKEIVPVPVPATPAPAPAPTKPQATDTPAPVAQDTPAPVATAQASIEAPKSEFAARAEKMIGLAMTGEAAEKIKEQIEKSEKIPEAEKPALLDLVNAKILDLESNVW